MASHVFGCKHLLALHSAQQLTQWESEYSASHQALPHPAALPALQPHGLAALVYLLQVRSLAPHVSVTLAMSSPSHMREHMLPCLCACRTYVHSQLSGMPVFMLQLQLPRCCSIQSTAASKSATVAVGLMAYLTSSPCKYLPVQTGRHAPRGQSVIAEGSNRRSACNWVSTDVHV
jgi:hypothetical protein